MSSVKLSVVMAVRDGQPYLRDALESVLAQSIGDFEFLIVDDGSSDGTRDILWEYQQWDSRISVSHNDSPQGPYPSTNGAMASARGHYIARHDADDVSPPQRFAIQLEALEADAEICLVTGAIEVFRPPADVIDITSPPLWQPQLEWELLFHNVVGAGAHVMFPRMFRGKPVRYSTNHHYAEDYALWCNLSRIGRVVCPADIVYRYRVHERSISRQNRIEQNACFTDIRREYQRLYLNSEISLQLSSEISRFWRLEGSRRLAQTVTALYSSINTLSAGFLTYVEHRYGAEAKKDFARWLDAELDVKLGFWLFWSARFGNVAACFHVLALAVKRGHLTTTSNAAFRRLGSSVISRLQGT